MKIASFIALAVLLVLVMAGAFFYTPDKDREKLLAAYGVAPGDFLSVAGLRLHLRDAGPREAPVVILLHGFGSSLQTWDAWADALQARFRVVRFDLPGFGLTGPDPTGDYTDARTMDVLLAVMDRLGIRRAALIGNSLGGKVAWMMAAAHPDRVTRLVLISPDGYASPGFEYDTQAAVPAMMRLLPFVLPTFLLRMSLAPAFGDPARLSPALLARYRDMLLAPGVRGAMLARMAQVRLTRPGPALRRIQAPTLLLWGDRDAMIPFSNAADYDREIPHCRLAALAGIGHVPQEEAPAQSLAPIEAFLRE